MRTLKIVSAIGAIVLAGSLGLTACSSGDKNPLANENIGLVGRALDEICW